LHEELAGTTISAVFTDLYRSSWRTQSTFFADDVAGQCLLTCATPILAFGRWQTARMATAGLNPSKREFLGPDGLELSPNARRFVHRATTDDSEPSNADIAEALRLAEGYFELGHDYTKWFRGFKPLLDEIGCSYEDGSACHTDYVSPFATAKGIGSIPAAARHALARDGLLRWRSMLGLMPECRVVLGIGAGWKIVPSALGFGDWLPIETYLDAKGGGDRSPRPHFLHAVGTLSQRQVHAFWWRPNRGEPLSYLNDGEKSFLGRLIRDRTGI